MILHNRFAEDDRARRRDFMERIEALHQRRGCDVCHLLASAAEVMIRDGLTPAVVDSYLRSVNDLLDRAARWDRVERAASGSVAALNAISDELWMSGYERWRKAQEALGQ